MLLAEYDYETDIAVQRAEEHETAKNLLEMGFAIEAIVRATGLSKEEVENI